MSSNETEIAKRLVAIAMDALTIGALDCVKANKTVALHDALRDCEQAMRDLLMTGYKSDNLWVNLSTAQKLAREVLAKEDGQ